MRKKAIAIASLACMCLMSGCSSDIEQELAGDTVSEEASDTASMGDGMSDNIKKPEDYVANLEYADNRIEISEYKKLYDTDIQALTTGEHSNIDFVDCYFRPIDEMEEVGIYNLEASTLGVEESIGYIKDLLKSEGCEGIDLEAELRDASGQVGGIPGENEEWPAVYDIYDKLTEGHGFFINSKEFYVQMWGFGYNQVSNGDITRYLGLDSLPAMDCFGSNTDDNIIETYAFRDAKEMEWELTDGVMSVGEAAELTKKYFEAGIPMPMTDGVECEVTDVSVYTLGDKYGYKFNMRRVYNGIPFMKYSFGQYRPYTDAYAIRGDTRDAYVIGHDTVSAFTGDYNESQVITPLVDEESAIIGLKDATEILRKYMSGKLTAEVDKVEFVYTQLEYPDEEYIINIHPCWYFRGKNKSNEEYLYMCVNALTGDVYYYSSHNKY